MKRHIYTLQRLIRTHPVLHERGVVLLYLYMKSNSDQQWDDFWNSTRGTEVDEEIEGLDSDSTIDVVDFDDMSDDLAV